MRFLSLSLALLMASCSGIARQAEVEPRPARYTTGHLFLGWTDLTVEPTELDPSLGLLLNSDVDTMPTVGFSIQRPMVGERLQLGLEGGMSFGWEYDSKLVKSGDSSVLVTDNDLFLMDLFAGLHANFELSERTRLYAGAGPLLQYANTEFEFVDDGDFGKLDESGFGSGAYGRVGVEWTADAKTSVGFALRYFDSSTDLDGAVDELELEGVQFLFAITRRL
jgi:hypothetical protein